MKKSAGILMFRRTSNNLLEVLLVHPGGPFWKNKDAGAWTIPKGEFTEEELALDAARREFEEETGVKPNGKFLALPPVRQKAGKWVFAWAIEGNLDAGALRSNTYQQEWPYKSGQWQTFPEVDKAAWFDLETAMAKINAAQQALLTNLVQILNET